MKVADIMTTEVAVVAPQAFLEEAARRMRDGDLGILPVGEHGKLVGVLTDRDIVVRAVARGRPPAECHVAEVMSAQVCHVAADAELADARRLMREQRVRRLPVLDHNGRLVGMVSLGDLALADPQQAGKTLQATAGPLVNRAAGFAKAD